MVAKFWVNTLNFYLYSRHTAESNQQGTWRGESSIYTGSRGRILSRIDTRIHTLGERQSGVLCEIPNKPDISFHKGSGHVGILHEIPLCLQVKTQDCKP